jgi:hypothetical protein
LDPTKAVPKVIVPPAQAVSVDSLASPVSPPAFSSLQPNQSGYTLEPRHGVSADIMPPKRYDNPLFRNCNAVIPSVDRSEPWMRRGALELLNMYGIEDIANGDPGAQFVVAAMMNASLTEVLRVELRPFGNSKRDGECLLLVQRSHGLVRFLEVDAGGLPAAQVKWFESLDGKIIRNNVFSRERANQYRHNEAEFRKFYRTIGDRDPGSFRMLHAWVTLDDGRIEYVDVPGQFRRKLGGSRTDFSAMIVEGAAHVSCTNRRILHGMPSMYLAYFHQPFVTIRDVVSAVIEGVLGEEMIPGEGGENVDLDAASGGPVV